MVKLQEEVNTYFGPGKATAKQTGFSVELHWGFFDVIIDKHMHVDIHICIHIYL